MILHLKDMDEHYLASQIYQEQVDKGWLGLAKEAKDICEELHIEDVNTTAMNKSEFKRLVKGAIQTKHEANLREQSQGKTKCSNIMKEGYGKKEYMNEKKRALGLAFFLLLEISQMTKKICKNKLVVQVWIGGKRITFNCSVSRQWAKFNC